MEQQYVKIILAIFFLTCLFNMPYGYYQLVRFIAVLGFGFLTYTSYEQDRELSAFIYILLALLFQPIFKISLGRDIWNIVDVFVAMGLIGSILFNKKTTK